MRGEHDRLLGAGEDGCASAGAVLAQLRVQRLRTPALRRRGEITESSNGWGGRHRHEKWGFTGLRMKSITAT